MLCVHIQTSYSAKIMPGSNPSQARIVPATRETALAEAVRILGNGGIAALPTETVYGLGADAGSADAVAAIYAAKGRPSFNPLIVHVANLARANEVAEFSALATRLAERFWPGPLTLVLPLKRSARIAAAVTAGLDTIALRVPAHPVMQAVLQASRLLLAAPSANRSGAISPTTARHVADGLGDKVPLILDGGACEAGLESTIVAVRGAQDWHMLRPGPITPDEIEAVAGRAQLRLSPGQERIEAPGQLASHYAPSKPVRLNVETPRPGEFHIGFGDVAGDYNLSPDSDIAKAAARLYAALHLADASAYEAIAVAPVPADGIGQAINDRLCRAAA